MVVVGMWNALVLSMSRSGTLITLRIPRFPIFFLPVEMLTCDTRLEIVH